MNSYKIDSGDHNFWIIQRIVVNVVNVNTFIQVHYLSDGNLYTDNGKEVNVYQKGFCIDYFHSSTKVLMR